MESYYSVVQNTMGHVVNGSVVTVYDASTGNPVSALYRGDGATLLSNPFTSGYLRSEGEIEFAAPNGIYNIRIVTGTETDWIYNVVLDDSVVPELSGNSYKFLTIGANDQIIFRPHYVRKYVSPLLDANYTFSISELNTDVIILDDGAWTTGRTGYVDGEPGRWNFINIGAQSWTMKTAGSALEKAVFVSVGASELFTPNPEQLRFVDAFSTPGGRIFFGYTDGATYSRVRRYSVTTPYTFTGASLDQTSVNLETLIGGDWNTRHAPDVRESTDGTKIYVSNPTNIFQLGTSGSSVTSGTLTYSGIKKDVSGFSGSVRGFDFNVARNKIFISDADGAVHQCTMTGDASTITHEYSLDISGQVTSPGTIRFMNTDADFVVADKSDGSFHRYHMTTAGDLQTAEWRYRFADSAVFTAAGKMGFDIPAGDANLLMYAYSVSASENRPITYSINTSTGVEVAAGKTRELISDGALVRDPDTYRPSHAETLSNKTLIAPIITSMTWAAAQAAIPAAGSVIKVSDVGINGGALFLSDGTNIYPASGTQVRLELCPMGVFLAPDGTMGANGAFTLGTSLPVTLGGATPRIWLYFPAGAVYSVSAAGFYWCILSTPTTGTAYNNIYVPGSSSFAPPASPTPIVDAGPGAFTGTTNEITTHSVLMPGKLMGRFGSIIEYRRILTTSSANTKTTRLRLNGTATHETDFTALVKASAPFSITNIGSESAQSYNPDREWATVNNVSSWEKFTAVDTSADVTITLTLQRSNSTEALGSFYTFVDVEPRYA